MKTIFTGIKPTGELHIGNYFGALKPALELASNPDDKLILFIADLHALNMIKDAETLRKNTLMLASALLAAGGDKKNIVIYLQSDLPEVCELNWILNNVTPKGLLNRAHAYKSVTAANLEQGNDGDHNINMGLYCYPVLMASDILLSGATYVPVGPDQKQHLEITKEIARVFNNTYGETFTLPVELEKREEVYIVGLDGRKMSKSYGNTIKLFDSENNLKKCINKIVTNSQAPEEPKDTNTTIFQIYSLFATDVEIEKMKKRFAEGIGWGEVKKETFEVANRLLAPLREKYNFYMENPNEVKKVLDNGKVFMKKIATETLEKVHKKIGKF